MVFRSPPGAEGQYTHLAQASGRPRHSRQFDWIDRNEFTVQINAVAVFFVQLALIRKWEYIPIYRNRENIPKFWNK
jgi:hypothetical protein